MKEINMITVTVNGVIGKTTSIIPHSSGKYPVWTKGANVKFIKEAEVRIEKCSVCKAIYGINFIEITNCFLCNECNEKLADSFEYQLTIGSTYFNED